MFFTSSKIDNSFKILNMFVPFRRVTRGSVTEVGIVIDIFEGMERTQSLFHAVSLKLHSLLFSRPEKIKSSSDFMIRRIGSLSQEETKYWVCFFGRWWGWAVCLVMCFMHDKTRTLRTFFSPSTGDWFCSSSVSKRGSKDYHLIGLQYGWEPSIRNEDPVCLRWMEWN